MYFLHFKITCNTYTLLLNDTYSSSNSSYVVHYEKFLFVHCILTFTNDDMIGENDDVYFNSFEVYRHVSTEVREFLRLEKQIRKIFK